MSSAKDIAVELLQEIPPDASIFVSICGKQITAKEMIVEVEEETEFGRGYMADLFRVARDLVAEQARRTDE